MSKVGDMTSAPVGHTYHLKTSDSGKLAPPGPPQCTWPRLLPRAAGFSGRSCCVRRTADSGSQDTSPGHGKILRAVQRRRVTGMDHRPSERHGPRFCGMRWCVVSSTTKVPIQG